MPVYILAIESSCDETSASVAQDNKIISNVIANQKIHEKYGGVVPELASRDHQKNIVSVVEAALDEAKVDKSMLNAIAFTRGPGLMGSLLVGISFAKGMALGLSIPLIEVHHMQAHVLAHFIDEPKPTFPFLCLTVSGGHTQLVWVKDYWTMEVVGQTQDDAVGEAFDKTAKMLGLPYPGGPIIDKLAQQGNPLAYAFPKSEMPDLDFSFSGFKTAVLYFLQKQTAQNPHFVEENLPDICASIQHTLVEMLVEKLRKASKQFHCNEIAIAGGVAANSYLRKRLQEEAWQHNWNVFIPDFQYCTDNAAMVAIAAYYKYLRQEFTSHNVTALPRWNF